MISVHIQGYLQFMLPKNSLLLKFGKTDPAFDMPTVILKYKGDSKEFGSLQLSKKQNFMHLKTLD